MYAKFEFEIPNENVLFRCMFFVNERPPLLKQNIVQSKTPGSP